MSFLETGSSTSGFRFGAEYAHWFYAGAAVAVAAAPSAGTFLLCRFVAGVAAGAVYARGRAEPNRGLAPLDQRRSSRSVPQNR